MSRVVVFDIETDGFNPSKIHCLTGAIKSGGKWHLKSTTDYEDMRKMCEEADVLVGHNITSFDVPVMEKILGIKVTSKLRDTLGLSWYMYPTQFAHGLEDWGVALGTAKKKIDDWEGLTSEEYIERCESDVRINTRLWDKMEKDLKILYQGADTEPIMDYIQFKMYQLHLQEQSKWRVDMKKVQEHLDELVPEYEGYMEKLAEAMPKIPIIGKVSRPKEERYYKADGSKSVAALKYEEAKADKGLQGQPAVIEVIKGYKDPNPGSTTQIKNWLTSIGWKPETFDYKGSGRDQRKIPQLRVDAGDKGKVLCKSVEKLIDKEPAIELLSQTTLYKHRIGILEGFVKNARDGKWLVARASGFTNTLRLRHAELVNLPGVGRKFGAYIRGVLIASDEKHELCGSDMSALEDRTKQHYMWEHDPEYVKEMMTEDFDPHLDLAVVANMLTEAEARAHKLYSKVSGYEDTIKDFTGVDQSKVDRAVKAMKEVKAALAEMGYEDYKEANFSSPRKKAKTANYACTYGVQAKTLSRNSGMSVQAAQDLIDSFWKRNWSLKHVESLLEVKKKLGVKWQRNPVNGLWYWLKNDKDQFSTLNQGTGAYAFDMWIKEILDRRPQLTGQFHDEIILDVLRGHRESCTKFLKRSIAKVNKKLSLNRDLDIDVQFGDSYADIH